MMIARDRRKVLIVDDCLEDRETYRRYLVADEQYSYEIWEEEYGEDGLNLCKLVEPDAILLDFLLPDINGIEFLSELKLQLGKTSLPVVMLTGHGNEAIAVQAMKSGASDYLVKGKTTPESLRLAIHNVVERAYLLRQLEQSEQRRKQVQERLRLLESVVINANDAVIITSAMPIEEPGPCIIYVNEAFTRMTGYLKEEVLGKSPRMLQGPKTDRKTLAQLRAALKARQSIEVELINYRKDGSEFWVDVSITPVTDNSGEYTHFVAIQRDISDRKQFETERIQLLASEQAARAAAEKANQAKDIFLAMVSHDLRNPINAILSYVQLLKMPQMTEVRANRALEIIEQSAKLQGQLIEDLLDISRISSGKLSLDISSIDLLLVVLAATDTMRLAAQAKTIDLKLTIVGERSSASMTPLPSKGKTETQAWLQNPKFFVSGDENRLQQVVLNLLSNAIKFTPKGGSIQVQLESADGDAKLTVSDTGCGISAEFLPYVFDQFRQADSENRHIGLGLGLAIARHIIELHGGTIQVESPGIDQGAMFTVKLPLVENKKAHIREHFLNVTRNQFQ